MIKVNNILHGPGKKYILVGLAIVGAALGFLILLKGLFYVKYNDRDLKAIIAVYFKNAHGKAVKFEEASVDSFGDIIIRGFIVSNSSDFNDNINLVKCRKAVIRVGLLSHFSGQAAVTDADFYGAELTLVKRYGRTYEEFIKEIIDVEAITKQGWAARGISVGIHDARVHYREFLRDGRFDAEFDDVSFRIGFDRQRVSGEIKGRVYGNRAATGDRGWVSLKGWQELGASPDANLRIKLDGVDASYANEYLKQNLTSQWTLRGRVAADVKLERDKGGRSLKGTLETTNLHLTDVADNHAVIANENLDIAIDVKEETDGNRWVLRKCKISDSVISVSAAGDLATREKDSRLNLTLTTNTIDLEDLSRNFSPANGYTFGGSMSAEGSLAINLTGNTLVGSSFRIEGKDLAIHRKRNGEMQELLSKTVFTLNLKGSDLRVSLAARSGATDVSVQWQTAITNLSPLSSKTTVVLTSNVMEAGVLAGTIAAGLDTIFTKARDDSKRGYEDIFFLQKKAGKIINSNDISLSIKGGAITVGKKARFTGWRTTMQLKSGIITLDEFALSGYGGRYSADLRGTYNTDQPFLSFRGSVRDLDLEAFARDAGISGTVSGIAMVEWDFELSAYRFSQILENSKGNLKIEVAKGEIRDTVFQNRVNEFLHGLGGFESASVNPAPFTNMSFALAQGGERFYLKQVGMTGESVNFQAYGVYGFKEGIQLPVNLSLRAKDRMFIVPLAVSGSFLNPCLSFTTPKKEIKKLWINGR